MSKELAPQNIDICTITLDQVGVGSSCVIVECNLPVTLRTRLEEMGFTAGTTLTVKKLAPLGDPMEIQVRGYSMCIRKDTAKQFAVSTKREASADINQDSL